MKEERDVIRAGRIKFKKGTRTDHRETSWEPTARTGCSNGPGAEAGTDESRCKQASKKGIQGRTLCLAVSWLDSHAVFTRQLEALLGNLISKTTAFHYHLSLSWAPPKATSVLKKRSVSFLR